MALRFRDRFFTPPVARAMTSPLGIVLAGAGTALGIVVGLPVLAAAGVGAAAWAGRVALAVPRGAKGPRIDPFALQEPWRQFVQEAQQAKARFDRAVGGTRPGPLRDRLAELGDRIEVGVHECWRVASRGDDIDAALASIDVTGAQRELSQLHQAGRGDLPGADHVARTIESLEAQLASADRLARVSADARSRLRLLDARLDELVARAVELSVGPADTDVGALGTDVEGLVTEMEALRQAVEETNRPGPFGQALPGP
jgi:hypothetical protein